MLHRQASKSSDPSNFQRRSQAENLIEIKLVLSDKTSARDARTDTSPSLTTL
jgi:hypothetical protein